MLHVREAPRNDRPRPTDPPASARTPTPPPGGWPVWYLRDEDDVGESTEQGITVRTLLAAVQQLARERGWARTLVAGDQFFGWVESEPLVRISPDVYLLDDPPADPARPGRLPKMFRTWLPGQAPPRFAVEVVSDDWHKDYDHAPRKYDQLGTRELVIFDPEAARARHARRCPLQVFRRAASGELALVAAGDGPVHSAELDAWLVVVDGLRLRVARDPAGSDLVPTAEEQVTQLHRAQADTDAELAGLRAELARRDAELARRDAELARRDAELARRDAELAALRARLGA
jgi:Uma2 family endonuclease